MILHIIDILYGDYHIRVSDKCVRRHLILLSEEYRKRTSEKRQVLSENQVIGNNTISEEHVALMEYYMNNNPVVTSEQLDEMTIHLNDQLQSDYQVHVSAECVRKHLIRLSGERRKSLKLTKVNK